MAASTSGKKKILNVDLKNTQYKLSVIIEKNIFSELVLEDKHNCN